MEEIEKTVKVSHKNWMTLMNYKMVMHHNNINETIQWLIKEARKVK